MSSDNSSAPAADSSLFSSTGMLPEVFTALPGAYLLLTPQRSIVAATDAYLALTHTTREQLVGRSLPDVFSGTPGTLEAETIADLQVSLQQVTATGRPHEMPVQCYRLPNPSAPTVLVERYWQPRNSPVLDVANKVCGIIHSVSDVTEAWTQEQYGAQQPGQERSQLRNLISQAPVVVGSFEDPEQAVTAVNELMSALREQQELLQQILRQVPAAVATLRGPQHQYTFFNLNYQALTTNRATLGQTVAEALPELVQQGFIQLLDKVYATGEPFSGVDMPLRLHDPTKGRPEQRYVDFVYQPLIDGQGRTQGILAFIIETTERVLARKQAETLQAAVLAAVRRQKEERKNVFHLFEQSPAAICLLREPDHRIDYFNPAYQALFPGQQLQGRTLAQVQPAAGALIRLLNGVFATGTMQLQLEVPITNVADNFPVTRYFDFTYQAYREQDHIVGVSVFGLDVTEQVMARSQVQELNEELAVINEELKVSNEELGETNKQLTRTNTDLDTFVYTASHDLKVPIANIEGLLDVLSRDLSGQALGESVTHILGLMHESVLRFQQTIGHLADISHLQQQEDLPNHEAASLAAVVADVQFDLAPLLETTGAQVVVELVAMPELPLSLKNQRSVVYNLLSNALKYRHPNRIPEVHVHCQRHNETIVLTVQDNGLGLDERQQKRLFGLFQRLHTHVEGSGIGLYMVKKIVENAGGNVRVLSQVGVGSTFIVTLPLGLKRIVAIDI